MKKIIKYKKFLESIINHSKANYIITEDDAKTLYTLEEDNQAPDEEPFSNDNYNSFLSDVIGKTLSEYSKWRFPDEPDEQFSAALKVLKF